MSVYGSFSNWSRNNYRDDDNQYTIESFDYQVESSYLPDLSSVVLEEYNNQRAMLEYCIDDRERSLIESKIELLQEISFKDIWEKIKEFFRKIKDFILKIIRKIKEFFTGKKKNKTIKETAKQAVPQLKRLEQKADVKVSTMKPEQIKTAAEKKAESKKDSGSSSSTSSSSRSSDYDTSARSDNQETGLAASSGVIGSLLNRIANLVAKANTADILYFVPLDYIEDYEIVMEEPSRGFKPGDNEEEMRNDFANSIVFLRSNVVSATGSKVPTAEQFSSYVNEQLRKNTKRVETPQQLVDLLNNMDESGEQEGVVDGLQKIIEQCTICEKGLEKIKDRSKHELVSPGNAPATGNEETRSEFGFFQTAANIVMGIMDRLRSIYNSIYSFTVRKYTLAYEISGELNNLIDLCTKYHI